MKKIIALTAIALSAVTVQAQTTQIVRWANTIGGSTSSPASSRVKDAIKGMVEDAQSNTYVIGNYTGTISFEQWGVGINGAAQSPMNIRTFNSVNGSQDVFIARYDINGTCTWCTSIGGAGFDEGNAICMTNPASPSDFFITGTFNQSMNVEGNTLNVVASGYAVNDAFIIKYNTTMTSIPTAAWWNAFGGSTETCGTGIVTNGTNVFITGYYTEFCMDQYTNMILQKTHTNGVSGTSFTTPTPGYLEFPYHDMFVARYSNSGVYGAALHTFGSEDEVEGNGIALWGLDVYVTGTYKGNIRLTSAAAVGCNGHSDIFVARYPQSFTSATAATNATTAGGPSVVYQSAPTMPFYKQDEGYAICTSSFGIFITGRFMDQATFGAAGTFDPAGASTETYMYLVRYNATFAAVPVVVTGTGGYSEGRGLYLATGGIMSPSHHLFVTGGAMSTASINGTAIETNGYAAENVGFVARIAYTNATASFAPNANNFVDGIAQNNNYLNGTGANDIDVVGHAVSYRVGCGVRIGGRFSSKTAFGNREKTSSGSHDAFLVVRENGVSVTASTFNCGSGSVVLTGTGGTSPMWTGPGVSSATTSVTVTPTTTSTYTFSAASGTCANSISPVTVYNFPSIASADAGFNHNLCGPYHNAMIGTYALAGATYSWAPSTGLSSTTIAQPTATVYSTTTYTMTMTDKCGSVTTDVVTVFYDPICPHRLAGPAAVEEEQAFVVYPNPTNGQFNISCNDEKAKDILVYDMAGRLVYSQLQTTQTQIAIDLSGEPKGLYLIQVVNGEEIQTAKISLE